jgi:hypothetical protein
MATACYMGGHPMGLRWPHPLPTVCGVVNIPSLSLAQSDRVSYIRNPYQGLQYGRLYGSGMGGRGQQYTPYWYGNLWYTTSLQYAGGIPGVPYQYGLYCQAWPAPPSLIPAAYYQDLAGPASPCLIPAAYSQGSGLASLPFIDTSCILSASPSLIPAAYYGPASATLALILQGCGAHTAGYDLDQSDSGGSFVIVPSSLSLDTGCWLQPSRFCTTSHCLWEPEA